MKIKNKWAENKIDGIYDIRGLKSDGTAESGYTLYQPKRKGRDFVAQKVKKIHPNNFFFMMNDKTKKVQKFKPVENKEYEYHGTYSCQSDIPPISINEMLDRNTYDNSLGFYMVEETLRSLLKSKGLC